MKLSDLVSRLFPSHSGDGKPPRRFKIVVKELSRRHRSRLQRHFLALGPEDRLLRFGARLSDDMIRQYVDRIDFDRDLVFGVFDPAFRLVGVAHLAFLPTDQGRRQAGTTLREKVAEFGVSVSENARGLGIGSKLFERAAIHCRNANVDTLYMHYLSSNRTMMHIAVKAGMEIERCQGESDAWLRLPPASPGSVLQEAMDEQLAVLDYTFKSNVRRASRWLGWLPRQWKKLRARSGQE